MDKKNTWKFGLCKNYGFPWFSRIRGTRPGDPKKKDSSILGSILGFPQLFGENTLLPWAMLHSQYLY